MSAIAALSAMTRATDLVSRRPGLWTCTGAFSLGTLRGWKECFSR